MNEPKIYKGLILNDYGGEKNYATMIMEGRKLIETRMNRVFKYRGDIIICCGETNSVTGHKGLALCIVDLWKIRDMRDGDAEAACIGNAPGRKSYLLRDWRHFSPMFHYKDYAIQKNWQGLFDMTIPEGTDIIPRPDIKPFVEIETSILNLL